LGVTGVVVALAVSGCGGGSSGVSASSYASAVCKSVGAWAKDIQARSGALNVASIGSAAQGKTAILGFMTAAVKDTDTVVSQLQSAGTPSVSNGSTIAAALVTSFKQIDSALAAAETQANALPTTSPAAFKTAAQALATSVRTSLAGIGAGLAGLKSPELQKAAKASPACSTLGA
jgi:hypothetical protein